jgi:hypothetical protein
MKTHTRPLLIVALCVFGTSIGKAQTARPIVRPTTKQGTVERKVDPTVIRRQNVLVDVHQVRATNNQRLSLALFDRSRLTLVKDRQETTPKKGFIWYGKILGDANSMATLVVVEETLVGNVMTGKGQLYQIRYIGNGVHELREIDQSKFPREAQPLKPETKRRPAAAADTCSTDPPTDIDVMVVYTADARTAAGGNAAMEATIYLAVAETNQAYLNSQINQRLRLAHFEEVTYTESGNINTDLTRLQDGADTFIDNVPTLRNTFAADHVVLITENGGGFCGLGYMMETVSNAFESFAYSVVARSCATGSYSFGHELGHNMGADHDAANATSTGPYVYNRGYVDTAPTSPATPWRTIMSYNGSPSSTRLQFFSHPNINYPPGDPMGVSNASDNHLVLNNTATTTANFRCSSPGVGNVWMKDTWSDTGVEPDPLTASEDMWKSPYIWIRHSQDTNLVHQHEHENPEAGSTNWVYVKIHNGFSATTSGNLELYWANASTGLSWPTDWTLLTSITVNGFTAHSTRVLEAQWNSVPGPGHFCMVARWVSGTDPMATAETTDINANVRANNNIVWRNLNVVNLLPDASGDVHFIVRNVSKNRMIAALAVRPSKMFKTDPHLSFIGDGRVTLSFDGALMRAWRRGGSKGKGFRRDGNLLMITDPNGAVFENLDLEPEAKGYARIVFQRLPKTSRRTFVVDAIQTQQVKRQGRVIGGVSYEIRTDRDKR